MMRIRRKNRDLIINKLKSSSEWKNQFLFFEPNYGLKPSWFGLPIMINFKYVKYKKKFMRYLNAKRLKTFQIVLQKDLQLKKLFLKR